MKKLLLILSVLCAGQLQAQQIKNVSPGSANAGQTLDVSISGSRTHFTSASSSLMFYYTSGSSSNWVTNNLLSIIDDSTATLNISVASTAPTGWAEILCYNAQDGNFWKSQGIYINGVAQPAITSVSPSAGNAGQTLNISISGTRSHFTSGSPMVYFGFGYTNSINVINDSSITANVTIPSNTYSGQYDVSVYDYVDGYLTKVNGFTVNGISPPSISNLTPDFGTAGQTLDVTISGVATHFASASYVGVYFPWGIGSSTTTAFTINSDTEIVAHVSIPPGTPDNYFTVSVVDDIDGYLEKYLGFHVINTSSPQISSLTPNYGKQGNSNLTVTLTGVNTNFIQGSSAIYFFRQGSPMSMPTASNIQEVNSTTITFNVDIPLNADTGFYSISLSNYMTNLVKPNAFRVYDKNNSVLEKGRIALEISPNPASEFLLVKNPLSDDLIFTIYDLKGVPVFSNLKINGKANYRINLNELPAGMYILSGLSSNQLFQQKFIKQ